MDNLLEAFDKSGPHTEEDYEAVCQILLDQLRRNLDQIEADRHDSEKIGAEMRAITRRIQAL